MSVFVFELEGGDCLVRTYKSAILRKEEIKQTSLELFSKHGYQEITMEQIASVNNIARTTLYEYFQSKEDILYALIDEVVQLDFSEPISGSTKQQLEFLAASSIARVQNNYMLYKVFFQELPTLSSPTSEKIAKWQSYSMKLVQKVVSRGLTEGEFREGLTEETLMFLYRALIGQRLADLLILNNQVNPQEEAKRLIDLMYTGIKKTRD